MTFQSRIPSIPKSLFGMRNVIPGMLLECALGMQRERRDYNENKGLHSNIPTTPIKLLSRGIRDTWHARHMPIRLGAHARETWKFGMRGTSRA